MPSMLSKKNSPGPQYSRTLTGKQNTLFRLTLPRKDYVPYCCKKENQWSTYPELHSRRGTLFQRREGIGRSGVRHGEASQLCVWWTSQSSNRSQTPRSDLEETYCHCQPETLTTSSEAYKIRNSSRACSNFRANGCRNLMLSFLVTDVIISKRGGMLQYAIAYSISRRLFRSLFPMRTFFIHIQLAVDHVNRE